MAVNRFGILSTVLRLQFACLVTRLPVHIYPANSSMLCVLCDATPTFATQAKQMSCMLHRSKVRVKEGILKQSWRELYNFDASVFSCCDQHLLYHRPPLLEAEPEPVGGFLCLFCSVGHCWRCLANPNQWQVKDACCVPSWPLQKYEALEGLILKKTSKLVPIVWPEEQSQLN